MKITGKWTYPAFKYPQDEVSPEEEYCNQDGIDKMNVRMVDGKERVYCGDTQALCPGWDCQFYCNPVSKKSMPLPTCDFCQASISKDELPIIDEGNEPHLYYHKYCWDWHINQTHKQAIRKLIAVIF